MGEHKDRMLAGLPYIADDPELGADHRRATLLLEEFNATSVTEPARRTALLRELLGHLGEGTAIKLLTPTHPLEPTPRRERWEGAEPISVGDTVWLGGGVIVCPGVTIGADSVVGAGSVVTRDLPERVLAVGHPARVIRKPSDQVTPPTPGRV